MIYGVGCDLCNISRIAKAVGRQGFIDRVFTKKEQEYCTARGEQRFASFAARFAAKEAVLKALGTGLRDGKLLDVEIMQNDLGKPSVILHGAFLQLAEKLKITNWQLSLTHEKDYAAAFAVLEVENETD